VDARRRKPTPAPRSDPGWVLEGPNCPLPDGCGPLLAKSKQKLPDRGHQHQMAKPRTTTTDRAPAAADQTTALFVTLSTELPGHRANASHTTAFRTLLPRPAAEPLRGSACAMEVIPTLDRAGWRAAFFARSVFTNLSQTTPSTTPSMQPNSGQGPVFAERAAAVAVVEHR